MLDILRSRFGIGVSVVTSTQIFGGWSLQTEDGFKYDYEPGLLDTPIDFINKAESAYLEWLMNDTKNSD